MRPKFDAHRLGHWPDATAGARRLLSHLALVLGVLLLFHGQPLRAQQSTSLATRAGVGLHVSGFDYWTADQPFIDQFPRAGGWYTQCDAWQAAPHRCSDFAPGTSAWDTREPLDLDDKGWVRRLPAADDPNVKYRFVSALLFQGDAGARAGGHYVVRYEGTGVLSYGLAGRKVDSASRPGRDVVEVRSGINAGLLLTIRRTDPADPIRNIVVVPPGGVCTNDRATYVAQAEQCQASDLGSFVPLETMASKTALHPAYLADVRGFRALRFLGWSRVNDDRSVGRWADRAKIDAAMWNSADGLPLEAMFKVAREANADPWILLPSRADDDLVDQFAKLALRALGTGHKLIVEYGNEPWNTIFPAGRFYEDMARRKWAEAAKRGTPAIELRVNWHAWRAANICERVRKAFGDRSKDVVCVLNVQAANAWLAERALSCPLAAAELGGPCSRQFTAVAVAPYFGGYIGQNSGRAFTDPWATEPAAGLETLFAEVFGPSAPLNRAGWTAAPANGALAQARGWMGASKQLADRHGLVLFAYESGQHLALQDARGRPALLQLSFAANRDPRMGQAMLRNLDDWIETGGQLFMLFSHVGTYGQYGAWGLKEGSFDNSAAKWNAARSMRDAIACWWPGC